MPRGYALTTIDNPYHPIDELEKWKQWDEEHGYFTLNLIGGFSPITYSATDLENERDIDGGLKDILRIGNGLYKRVPLDED